MHIFRGKLKFFPGFQPSWIKFMKIKNYISENSKVTHAFCFGLWRSASADVKSLTSAADVGKVTSVTSLVINAHIKHHFFLISLKLVNYFGKLATGTIAHYPGGAGGPGGLTPKIKIIDLYIVFPHIWNRIPNLSIVFELFAFSTTGTGCLTIIKDEILWYFQVFQA